MAENGGSGRACYPVFSSPHAHSFSPPAVVVSPASPRVRHDPSSPLKNIHDDDEYYGDPNIDFDTEYLGASYLPGAPFPPAHPAHQRMSPPTPRCAPPSQTPTIQTCPPGPCAPGRSVCCGQSSSRGSTSSSSFASQTLQWDPYVPVHSSARPRLTRRDTACRPTPHLPPRTASGALPPPDTHLRNAAQSRPFLHKGTRRGHYHGGRRSEFRLRGAFYRPHSIGALTK